MVYYERYLMELKTVSNAQAIANASEEYNCSEMTIRRAIKVMEN
jgi:DeoR/GlpR family transcriptional regulator of sugar metabolism